MSSTKPRFHLDPSKIFTKDESYALRSLFNSYTTASAQVLFSANEIKVLRHLVKTRKTQSTNIIATETGLSNVTVKKELQALQDKELVNSEQAGRSTMWGLRDDV